MIYSCASVDRGGEIGYCAARLQTEMSASDLRARHDTFESSDETEPAEQDVSPDPELRTPADLAQVPPALKKRPDTASVSWALYTADVRYAYLSEP